MAKDYIDDDYVISYYSNSAQEYTTSYPSSSVVETVVTQSTSVDVLNNYTWTEATGSSYDDSKWGLISGTVGIAELNPNNPDDSHGYFEIGRRIEIRDNEIFTNVWLNSYSAENNGIAIYRSGSDGYFLSDYINIPTSSLPNTDSRLAGVEFSLDNNRLIVPIIGTYSGANGGSLQVYNSSSSGWGLETTLTITTFNDASPTPSTSGFQYTAYYNSVIKNNIIFANGFYSGNYNRYVAIFKSSSAGWAYEDQVQVADVSDVASTSYGGRIGNARLNVDFDGTTGVLGSLHANSSRTSPYADSGDTASGRVHVIESGSSGWSQTVLGLESLGMTGTIDPSIGIPTSSFGGNPEEWYTWKWFGLSSCAVSGSYIAAAAIGKRFYDSSDSLYHRRKNAVFILRSGSAGWEIESQLDEPTENFLFSSSNGRDETAFGCGLSFGLNSLVVAAPEWQPDRDGDSGLRSGRIYTYVSNSSGGWTLEQTINNPYSGSTFHKVSSERNEFFGSTSVPFASGAGHFGSKPVISGSILAIGAPDFSAYPDDSGSLYVDDGVERIYYNTVYGALVVLDGSPEYRQETTQQVVTQSSETVTYVTAAGGPVPFRLGASRNAGNIRNQDENNSYSHYKP